MLGGYQPVTSVQVGNLLHAYLAGTISWQAVRIWFGCLEMQAIREAASRSRPKWRRRKVRFSRFEKEELVKLTGLDRRAVGRGMGQLERATLLEFESGSLRLDFPAKPEASELIHELSGRRSVRRLIPIPRTAVRFLASSTSSATGRVMIAYWVRGLSLYRQTREVRGRGTVKATWIANVFGLSLRAVRYAQNRLRGLNWITKDTGSKQWKLNRDGAYFQINLEWKPPLVNRDKPCEEIAPPVVPMRAPAAPPIEDKFTPSESKNQKSRRTPGVCNRKGRTNPAIHDIQCEDLRDAGRLRILFRQATARNWVRNCEADELKFFSAAVRAREAGREAPRIFAGIVRRGLWQHVTTRQEETARRWLGGAATDKRKRSECERIGNTLANLLRSGCVPPRPG
jgi:hypothetical protein